MRQRRQREGPIRDAGVDVHAAVVLDGLDIVPHVSDLRIPADLGVVVRRSGLHHRAQRAGVDPGQEQSLPDQPVRLVRRLGPEELLGHGREYVADALVQRAGLVLIDQPRGELGDPVGELVSHHVRRLGEPVEHHAVAVAEHQLSPVPEGVVIVDPIVDSNHQRGAVSVHRAPPELIGEHVQHLARGVVRLVHRGVADGRIAHRTGDGARQRLGVGGGVDDAGVVAGDRHAPTAVERIRAGRAGGRRGRECAPRTPRPPDQLRPSPGAATGTAV